MKEYMHVYVHCSIIYNSQDLEAAQVPISRLGGGGGEELWYIYTMEYYSAIKKKKIFTLCNRMYGPGEHYAK